MQNLKIAYLRTTLRMVMDIMMIRSYMDDAFIHGDDSWTNEQDDTSSRIFDNRPIIINPVISNSPADI